MSTGKSGLFCPLIATLLLLPSCRNAEDSYAQQYKDRVAKAEDLNLASLKAAANGGQLDERNHIASVFISQHVINDVLHGAEGTTIAIPKYPKAQLSLGQVNATFSDGFPLIEAEATLSDPSLSSSIKVHLALELVYEIRNGSLLVMTPTLLAIDPEVHVGSLDFKIKNLLSEIVANRVRSKLPSIEVPISRTSNLDQAASQRSISFPTSAGSVTGVLKIPALSADTQLSISQVVFLSDGVHVFIDGGVHATAPRG